MTNGLVFALCQLTSSCTLGNVFTAIHKQIAGAAQSMEPGSAQLFSLSSANVFRSIVGVAPASVGSGTEKIFDLLINAFVPGQTVASILNNQLNDTLVPITGQDPPGTFDSATVAGILHTNVCDAFQSILVLNLLLNTSLCSDTGETQSQAVWSQAYWWLTGGTAYAPPDRRPVSGALRPLTSAPAAPPPVLDLSGYSQVPASNVTFSPAAGSILTVNSTSNITATSSTKTITEVLLLQAVTDPTDTLLMYATQSPFTIPFNPARLGSTTFSAITVFSDNTYAITAVNYTFQVSGAPYALNLWDPPLRSLAIGGSIVVDAVAQFSAGPVDVTSAATYPRPVGRRACSAWDREAALSPPAMASMRSTSPTAE